MEVFHKLPLNRAMAGSTTARGEERTTVYPVGMLFVPLLLLLFHLSDDDRVI